MLARPKIFKTFVFGLSIMRKHGGILLTSSTGAAAADVNGAKDHSDLGCGKNGIQLVR
jgi:hypothetical protein